LQSGVLLILSKQPLGYFDSDISSGYKAQ
jgi:hypothetical protein